MATVLSVFSEGRPEQERKRRSAYEGPTVTVLCLFIGLVSAYDAYLTMAYSTSLIQMEHNPVGRLVMGLDASMYPDLRKVAVFLGIKFSGTILAISMIHMLFHFRRHWAVPIAWTIALLQLILLAYLQFGT